jgi:hypothetical protein
MDAHARGAGDALADHASPGESLVPKYREHFVHVRGTRDEQPAGSLRVGEQRAIGVAKAPASATSSPKLAQLRVVHR